MAASKTDEIYTLLSTRLEILLNGHFQKLKYLQEAVEEAIFDLKFKESDNQLLDKLDSVKSRLADHILAHRVAIKLYSEFYFSKYRLSIAIQNNKNIKSIQIRSNWIEDRLVKLLHRRDRAGARVRRRDRQESSCNFSTNIVIRSNKQLVFHDSEIQDYGVDNTCISAIDKNNCFQNQLFDSKLSASSKVDALNQSQLCEMNLTNADSPKSRKSIPSDVEPCSHLNKVYNTTKESCMHVLTPSSQPVFESDLKDLSTIYFSEYKMFECSQRISPKPIHGFSDSDHDNLILSCKLNTLFFKNNKESNIFNRLEREMVSHYDVNRYSFANNSLYPKEFDLRYCDTSTPFISNQIPRFQMSIISKRINNLPKPVKNTIATNESPNNCDTVFLTTTLKALTSADSKGYLRTEILKLLQTMPNYISDFISPIYELFSSDTDILVRYEAMKILISFSPVKDEILYFSNKVFSLCNSRIQFDLLQNFRKYLPILHILSSLILNDFKKCLEVLFHDDLGEISIESLLLLAYYFPSSEYSDVLSSILLSNKSQQYSLPICVFFVKYLKLTDSVLFFIFSRLVCDSRETNRIEIAKLLCMIQPTDWSLNLRNYCYSILSKLLWKDPSRFVRDQVRQTILEVGLLDEIIRENMTNLNSSNELIKLRAIKSFGSLREIDSQSTARLLEILETEADPTIKLQTIRTLSILSLNEIYLQSFIIDKAKGDGYIAWEAQKFLKYYNL